MSPSPVAGCIPTRSCDMEDATGGTAAHHDASQIRFDPRRRDTELRPARCRRAADRSGYPLARKSARLRLQPARPRRQPAPLCPGGRAIEGDRPFRRDAVVAGRQPGLGPRRRAALGVLSDTAGEVTGWYALTDSGDSPALTTYALDPGLRVLHVDRGGDPTAHVDHLLYAIAAARSPAGQTPKAPVLWIPRVMDRAFCDERMRWWNERGKEASGAIDNRSNSETDAYAQVSKRRRDHEIVDPGLNQRLADIFRRRVVPEVAKAFQYQASRTTGFKIGGHLDRTSTGGYFRAHRDNISPISAHRRFAVSLRLNDASDYVGGGLRFLECGDEVIRANAGEALVFSCSLLHEVTEVEQGTRFVRLTFLTDEQAIRAARRAARPLGALARRCSDKIAATPSGSSGVVRVAVGGPIGDKEVGKMCRRGGRVSWFATARG
ncbi:MAG: 2OG-Fe(II) oxygenase [Alphaproteobacteria bacterium]|nr:2OG-Fe(II) oxygenase [Alphaproteobacteria bacterium]